ncbi:MAG TPA: alanine--glyoxylate aminotransferase family protein [Syntrophomonadaceae bacterium]|nr:alanine--glyoxylate aminotransferase family protein [Syntrophomonadaceae bacterium]
MRGEQYLLLPGPTPVPEKILRAMSMPMINHRGPEFKELLMEVTEGVKKVFATRQKVLIYPSSGSGMLEAAVVNFISPGDKVLAVSIGVFGDRFAKIAAEFGADVQKISFPWGEAADPQAIKEILDGDKNHEIKAILITQNETSTGVYNDLKAIREATLQHPALFMVDAVSGLGAIDLRMDEWNLDVVVSGSQKAFMLPPGLGFMAFNEKALKVHRQSTNSKFYWDVTSALKYFEKGQTPYTPAISLFFGLRESLIMIKEEGLENTLARHRRYRDLIRAGVKEMGLQLLADDKVASCAVTSVIAPEEIGANKIRKYMLDEFNIVLAGGQQNLDNVIFRIGHLGYVRELDLLAVLAALEVTLVRLGCKVEMGAGLRKAETMLLEYHQ